ncbi:MAG: hypothetical protein RL062_1488, partial [Bacteroidota bacterium]
MKNFLLLGALFTVKWVLGQSSVAPKYVNEFLNIGAGARGYAMSGAVVS